MANDYFNHSSTLTKHTLARAAQVNSVFESIAAGLDKLPGADPLNQGRVTYVSDTGAADAYVVSLSKAPSSYTAGLSIVMKAANTNTGASTIDVNSLGVKNIKRYDGTDLVANDILASALIHLVYDGTAFRIVGANGAESALAKEWASKTGGTVDGSEHSAKSWAQETGGNAPTAGSAKEWATETSTVDGGLKGARGYAQDASSSASAAATSETNAESHYDTFRGVFYGPLSSDPSTDPNGDALDAGDWYFNTTTGTARQYDGSVWKDLGAATLNTFVFTASGGETSLSGADDNGNTLTYTVDFIQVHRNGALLTPDDDYTGSDGSSITGLPAAIAGDVYVIDAFSNLSLANVYTKDEIDEWDPEHATGTDTYVSAENTSPPGTGKRIVRDFQNANTGSTPTLDGRTITDIDGNALWAGALNRVHDLLDDGTNYRVINPIGTAANVANAPVKRDANKRFKAADPSAAQDVVTKTWGESNLRGLVPISQITASDDATVEFTSNIDSTYDEYVLIISGFRPATDGSRLFMRVSTDGGSNWDSGATDYSWAFDGLRSDGTVLDANSNGDTKISHVFDTTGNSSGESGSVTLYISGIATSRITSVRSIAQSFDNSTRSSIGNLGGNRRTGQVENAIQFLASSGNIASGVFRLYGVKNS